jgi:hypothetical protein
MQGNLPEQKHSHIKHSHNNKTKPFSNKMTSTRRMSNSFVEAGKYDVLFNDTHAYRHSPVYKAWEAIRCEAKQQPKSEKVAFAKSRYSLAVAELSGGAAKVHRFLYKIENKRYREATDDEILKSIKKRERKAKRRNSLISPDAVSSKPAASVHTVDPNESDASDTTSGNSGKIDHAMSRLVGAIKRRKVEREASVLIEIETKKMVASGSATERQFYQSGQDKQVVKTHWRPNVVCCDDEGGDFVFSHTLAKRWIEDEDVSARAAMECVMFQYPERFGIQVPAYWNPVAICGMDTAYRHGIERIRKNASAMTAVSCMETIVLEYPEAFGIALHANWSPNTLLYGTTSAVDHARNLITTNGCTVREAVEQTISEYDLSFNTICFEPLIDEDTISAILAW